MLVVSSVNGRGCRPPHDAGRDFRCACSSCDHADGFHRVRPCLPFSSLSVSPLRPQRTSMPPWILSRSNTCDGRPQFEHHIVRNVDERGNAALTRTLETLPPSIAGTSRAHSRRESRDPKNGRTDRGAEILTGKRFVQLHFDRLDLKRTQWRAGDGRRFRAPRQTPTDSPPCFGVSLISKTVSSRLKRFADVLADSA